MREYKFRGKSLRAGKWSKWIYGSLDCTKYTYKECRIVANNDPIQYWHTVDKETVGQYVGLKDKNGKEIYERDIVYIIPEDERGIIRWDNETARFVVIYDNIITDFDNWYGKDLEVIGNIYDNPELLKEGE